MDGSSECIGVLVHLAIVEFSDLEFKMILKTNLDTCRR